MFVFKKIVSSLLFPIPICLFLLVVIIAFQEKIKHHRFIMLIAVVIMYTSTTAFFVNPIISVLEHRYPRVSRVPAEVRYIVVLGGDIRSHHAFANQSLGDSSLARVTEAIRLTRLAILNNKNTKLILSGGGLGATTSAKAMYAFALQNGVPKQNLILENRSLDTEDEAQQLQPILRKTPFLLVTSAVHMPRSMLMFSSLDMKPIAAPCEFNGHRYYSIRVLNFIPSATIAARFHLAWHEILGMTWYRLRHDTTAQY